ncbi:MAG: DUF115 domain-containing protein [Treponema sp.]|nr:DUF115 domain-containing protein [Treponema sp.]
MRFTFAAAKNGLPVCSAGNVQLHSFYDPSREAERFADLQNPPFEPAVLIVTEPALSYCKSFLACRFPSAQCWAIRYTGDFFETDTLWDKVLYAPGKNAEAIAADLFSALGEENLFATAFISWEPSERAFPEESAAAWEGIRLALSKARDILGTREYFAKRWVKNAVRFSVSTGVTAEVIRGDSPILVAASGPSLKACLLFLRDFREHFFLIALSSALETLLSSGVIPDLCMSTDGGYWAKEHLASLRRNNAIPLACSPESQIPAELFANHPVIPLSYGDGIESFLLDECGIPSVRAERNGTVSGTTACFALGVTSGEVFFCGLDLAPDKGTQHTLSNQLDTQARTQDFRLAPLSHRYVGAALSSGALSLYRAWFSSQGGGFSSRFCRVSSASYERPLGKIRDISLEQATGRLLKTSGCRQPKIVLSPGASSLADRMKKLSGALEYLKEDAASDMTLKALFPAGYVQCRRDGDAEKRNSLKQQARRFLDELKVFAQKIQEASGVY